MNTLPRKFNIPACLRPTRAAFAFVFGLVFVTLPAANAQTFGVIYNFTGATDGAYPDARLAVDRGGNLYGTALVFGEGGGTVYKLSNRGDGWTFSLLYSFHGNDDGDQPAAVVFGPDGTLYGTTIYGGGGFCGGAGCGTVFNLKPPPVTVCRALRCPWTETILYRFMGGSDGNSPGPQNALVFGPTENIFGTTTNKNYCCGYGTVYEVTRSGGTWTESILHSFSGADGYLPFAGVILDDAGNLYGTTVEGGQSGLGTVFQLMRSGSGWDESVLYSFPGGSNGGYTYAPLVADGSGGFYGAASDGGQGGGGTIFDLTPSGSGWTYNLLYSLSGQALCGPYDALAMDQAGNLYGTTFCDGAFGYGNVFKLTHSNGGWTYTSLHDFTGGSDGAYAQAGVVFAANGNLYGTAFHGGSLDYGVVWEITP